MKNLSLNFIKGIFIGMGAILPGLSGGALAAIFGLYEPLVNFISNIKKDFKGNIKFFIPVVLGGIVGVFILSHVLKLLLEHNLAEISIFFVGCMLGIFPSLIKQASSKGREPIHIVLTIGVTIASFLILSNAFYSTTEPEQTVIGTYHWTLSGGIIGLGITFPGLSPSNFLMYLGLYQPLNVAISNLNFTILIPVAMGGLVSVILTAKLVTYLLRVAYATVYHIILGLVLTSTVMMIPREFNSALILALCLIAGLSVGIVMSYLEAKNSKKTCRMNESGS